MSPRDRRIMEIIVNRMVDDARGYWICPRCEKHEALDADFCECGYDRADRTL